MFFAILSVACVLYTDGQEHCDVRSKVVFEAPSQAVCEYEVMQGTMKIAATAFDNPAVKRVTTQEAYCYSSSTELAGVEQMLPDFMKDTGRTYVLTRY